MDLDAKCLDVVGAIGAAGEIGEVELDLVPPLVETHTAHEEKKDGNKVSGAKQDQTTDIPRSRQEGRRSWRAHGMVQMKGLTRVVDW